MHLLCPQLEQLMLLVVVVYYFCRMYWNKNWQGGMYAYGIKSDNATGQSSYSYNNLNTLNLGNTDLVFYLGCNTGQLDVSNNLVSSSKALGAKISMG